MQPRLSSTGAELGRPTARVATFAELAELVMSRPPRCGPVRLVAVDGPGGAGKSVFAERLARSLGDVPVIHTDDFASWENPVGWWPRLERDVLAPLEQGEPVSFRAYDWLRRRLGERRLVPPSDVVLLEGVSSSRQAVAERLSLAIWIETAAPERLARGIARDGPAMRDQWVRGMAKEDAHFLPDRARERADVSVDGSPTLTHDPETEYVALT